MKVGIEPCPLTGSISAVSSKSDAHRILICAALADKQTNIVLNGMSDDILATAGCLCALGAKIARKEWGFEVCPIDIPQKEAVLDCGESGSTLRFLLPVAAALGVKARFTGKGRLPERPIGHLKRVMEEHGVSFSSDKLPLEITGTLHAGEFELPGNISSQYVTGLMLAIPLAGDSTIRLTTKLESAAYVDITMSALEKFGVHIYAEEGRYTIARQKYISPLNIAAEGDWSNAAFFLAAGALKGGVTVNGLDALSVQGDRAVADILKRFGAEISSDGGKVTVRPNSLKGCEIDVSGVPDLLPVLAAVAACAEGETRFVNAARLRIKESDRLSAAAQMIKILGGDAEELPDGLIVRGGELIGGTVDSFNDHRIAMAASVAAISCKNEVKIVGAEAVNKSYPAFFEDYNSLGGKAYVL